MTTVTKRPNLIYVFADQLRYSSLGCNHNALARTPNIDRLFGESASTVMENAVSGHPICSSYRASLFTGKYPTSTGMVANGIRINPNHVCFAHVLDSGGYETAFIGKWNIYATSVSGRNNPINSFVPKGRCRLGFNDFFAAYNFHLGYYSPRAYYHLDTPEKIYFDGYETDAQTDIAIEQLERLSSGERPFAMFLSFGAPHDPWSEKNVPEEFLDMFKDTSFSLPGNYSEENDPHADSESKISFFDRKKLQSWMRVYSAMVSDIDYNVGRLLDKTDELGLSDNTIFVFTSDHGEMFGSHGRRGKNTFYDEAVRVPFVIRQKLFPAAHRCKACFNTPDIMVTLLSIMGLPVPVDAEGEDMSKFIISGKNPHNSSLMMGTGPTIVFGDGKEWRALRTEKYTYALYKYDNTEYLFDNENDALQMNNLAYSPGYREMCEAFRTEMYSKMIKIGDTFQRNSFYKKYWITDGKIRPVLK